MRETTMPEPTIIDASGLLDRQRTIALPGFNRWLVPPAALAIHLCIGMAYGFSVFWLPLTRAVGITRSVACPAEMGLVDWLTTRTCDWRITAVTDTFTLFIVALGLAAALWGGWLERAGPRKAGVAAAVCWSGGLVLGAIGISLHQIWILWLGTGVIGGIGLGLGYISPVSTLVKWFPDRRGMATGMAIMGFGGGAMIGSPLAVILMKRFATSTDVGVWQTFLVLAAIYFVVMMVGAFGYRVPPSDWRPAGWSPQTTAKHAHMATHHVHLDVAWRTRQFWLIWAVLCLNVTAGIGILALASPLLQEVFGGQLIGVQAGFNALNDAQRTQIATVAAGFLGLLSLFNIVGRFFWASLSDKLGRRATYATFFLLGIVLYATAPSAGKSGSVALFIAIFCVILSMYGGGFATVPAYLADMFGTRMVGAIHGRLLTAWSAAGVVGPNLVAFIRDYQIDHGVAKADAYSMTLYLLAGLLFVGFICNYLVTPVAARHYMSASELADEKRKADDTHQNFTQDVAALAVAVGNSWKVFAVWSAVCIPVVWGVWKALEKTVPLFG